MLVFPSSNVYLDSDRTAALQAIVKLPAEQVDAVLGMLQQRADEPLNPDRFSYVMARVHCLWRLNRRREALTLLQATCLEHPRDPHWRLAWAVALFNTGQLHESLAQVETLATAGATPPADLKQLRGEIGDRWSVIAKLRDLDGQGSVIRDIEFSPDDQFIASAGVDGKTRVWSVSDGSSAAVLDEHADMALCVAFSPNGKMLASSGYDGKIHLWTVPDFKSDQALEGHQDVVRSIAFAPDGSELVSVGDDGQLYVWDFMSRRLVSAHKGERGKLVSVKYAPDGLSIVTTAKSGELQVWDANRYRITHTLPASSPASNAMAFVANSNQLVYVRDPGELRLCALNDQKTIGLGTLRGAHSVVCSKDGKIIVVGCVDGTLKSVDARTGATRFSLNAQLSSNSVIAFSTDGQFVASASYDGGVRIWMSDPSRSLLADTHTPRNN